VLGLNQDKIDQPYMMKMMIYQQDLIVFI